MSERRAFTPQFKARVVLEELTGVKDKAEICREYGCCRRSSHAGGKNSWNGRLRSLPASGAVSASDGDEQGRIAELERLVGRLTMELEVAKKPRAS
jgi:transposase